MKDYIVYGLNIIPVQIKADSILEAMCFAEEKLEDYDGICSLEQWEKETKHLIEE